jgi:hypothetical protein
VQPVREKPNEINETNMEIIQEGLSVEEWKESENTKMENSIKEKEEKEKSLINISRKCEPVNNNHGKLVRIVILIWELIYIRKLKDY